MESTSYGKVTRSRPARKVITIEDLALVTGVSVVWNSHVRSELPACRMLFLIFFSGYAFLPVFGTSPARVDMYSCRTCQTQICWAKMRVGASWILGNILIWNKAFDCSFPLG